MVLEAILRSKMFEHDAEEKMVDFLYGDFKDLLYNNKVMYIKIMLSYKRFRLLESFFKKLFDIIKNDSSDVVNNYSYATRVKRNDEIFLFAQEFMEIVFERILKSENIVFLREIIMRHETWIMQFSMQVVSKIIGRLQYQCETEKPIMNALEKFDIIKFI